MRPTDAPGMPDPRFSLQELQRQPHQIQAACLRVSPWRFEGIGLPQVFAPSPVVCSLHTATSQFVSMSFANRFVSIFGVRYIQNDFAFDACGATRG